MKIVHASFWSAAIGSSFMGIALMMPFWLGRKNEDDSLQLYGAFYQFTCQGSTCETFASLLSSDAAPLDGRGWGLEVSALPIMALFGFILCFVAVTILEAISCRCCGDRLRTRRVIVVVEFLLIASAFVASLAICLAVYVCSEFYADNSIDHAAEFPWSLLFYCLADVLVILAAIMFVVILLRWDRYKTHYGHYGSLDDGYLDDGLYSNHEGSLYPRSDYDGSYYSRSRPRSSKVPSSGYINDGFRRESSFTNLSDFGKTRSDGGYFNFPGRASRSTGSGSNVMRASGRSMQNSAKLHRDRRDRLAVSEITRAPSYDEFIDSRTRLARDNRMAARSLDMGRNPSDGRLELPRSLLDEERIDGDMLRSGRTRYREDMLEEARRPRPIHDLR